MRPDDVLLGIQCAGFGEGCDRGIILFGAKRCHAFIKRVIQGLVLRHGLLTLLGGLLQRGFLLGRHFARLFLGEGAGLGGLRERLLFLLVLWYSISG